MTAAHPALTSPAPARPCRGTADRVLDVLAVAGTLCLLGVAVGATFQLSILMFRTGSMDPTIPAGSVAIAREIPAADISPGDVVTVDRGPDVLPLTHRVTEVSATDPRTGQTTFRMRGDANLADDPARYTETDVRLVMFSVPGGAAILQRFAHPMVLGGLTVLTSVLVGWAFWARDDDDEDSPSPNSAHHLDYALALLSLRQNP